MAIAAKPMWRAGAVERKPAPERQKPVLEPPKIQRGRGPAWPWLAAGLLLGILTYVGQSLAPSESAATPAASTPAIVVREQPFLQSIRLSGAVTARDSAAIRAPRLSGRSQLTLTELAEAGSYVKAGDGIARFQSQELRDRVDDMRSNVVQANARLDRERAKVIVERATIRQQRDRAKAEYDKAVFDMRKAEVLSEIQAEILRNTAEQAKAEWQQLDQEMKLQEEVFQRRLRIEEIDVADANLRYERFARDLDQMILRAPVGGLVVLEPMYKGGGQFQQAAVGDQVYPGTTFMRVVDLSGLLVTASVNQVDAQAVRVGQPATIRFDAYPDLVLEGRVSNVAAIASAGAGGFGSAGGAGVYVKTIPAEIAFETTDPRVIPDLSVAVDIRRHEQAHALTVPLSAVEERAGQTFVRVRDGQSWRRRPVELGERNEIEAVVLAGVESGDEIALR